MTKNLTQGSPFKLILAFTLPLLAGNIFQQLYNMADTYIVGRTIGVNALAAVGATAAIVFFVLGFSTGMGSGLAIVTAQCFGAEDYEGVRRSFAVSLVLALAVSAVLTALSVLTARPFLRLLQTPADIIDGAYEYIVVIFWGITTSMLFNLLASAMRAVGNSRSPLVFLAIACVLNIGLDYLFILPLGMGVAGAALATVVAQGVSVALCAVYIRKKLPVLRFSRRHLRFTRQDVTRHLRMGLPMAFQASIVAIGSLAVQFALNGLGTGAVAAYTAAQKINTLGTMPLTSIGTTMSTYAAQNYGAGRLDRVRAGVRISVMISTGFSAVLATLFITLGRQLSAIFLGGSASDILDMSHLCLALLGASYFSLGLLFIFRSSLQGLGKTAIPTVAGIVEVVMRCFCSIVLTRLWGFWGASLATPLAWWGAAVPLAIAYFLYMRRLRQQQPAAQ